MAKRSTLDDEFLIIPPTLPVQKNPMSPIVSPKPVQSKPSKRPSLKPKGIDKSFANANTMDELESLINNAKPMIIEDRPMPKPIERPLTPPPLPLDDYQKLFVEDPSLTILQIDVKTIPIESSPSELQGLPLIFDKPANLPTSPNLSYSVYLSSLAVRLQSPIDYNGDDKLLRSVSLLYGEHLICDWDLSEPSQTVAKTINLESKRHWQYALEERTITIQLPMCYMWELNGSRIPFVNDGRFIIILHWLDDIPSVRWTVHATMSVCNTPSIPLTLGFKRLVHIGKMLSPPLKFPSNQDYYAHDIFVICDKQRYNIDYLGLYKNNICLFGSCPKTNHSPVQSYENEYSEDNIYRLNCGVDGRSMNLKGCELSFMSVSLEDDEDGIATDVYALVEIPIYFE